MRKIFIFFFGMLSFSVFGQMKINQSAQIKELMEIKKEFAQMEKTFQIQVYNGNVSDANAEMKNVANKFSYPSTMTFETPNYKVRIGKFRTRLEAEKALLKVKNVYPAAFVIAPY
ncbi:MAG: SPOR domain-containing protein [Capnocytophaga sp.]|nr:SPOR domain-containing protein [Capnocytophaga sp.]